MARRNSKRVKKDNMSRRMLRLLQRKKLKGNPRKDGQERWIKWLIKKLDKENENEAITHYEY